MLLRLLPLLILILSATPAWAEIPVGEGSYASPPPVEVPSAEETGSDSPESGKEVTTGIRDTPGGDPVCGDGLVNGEEVCDPTALSNLMENVCTADCQLSVPASQFSCTLDDYNACAGEARAAIAAKIADVDETEPDAAERIAELRERFLTEQRACYQAAYQSCVPKPAEVPVETDNFQPEAQVPSGVVNSIAGSGCSLSAGALPGFDWSIVLLLSGFFWLRTRS